MPGIMKKVRFAKTKTVVSPPTPVLSAGSLSPASSGAVVTPPNYPGTLPSRGPGPTPYNPSDFYNVPSRGSKPHHNNNSYVPAQAPSVQVHRYLESSSSSHPAIYFDMINHPRLASRHQRALSPQSLDEPATNPPLPSITLKHDSLPWQLRIVAMRRSYVTLQDVLEQLYNTLRSNIGQGEYDRLGTSERNLAISSYEQRYRRFRSRSEYEWEKAGGVKRVDLLLGHSKFFGLSRTKAYDVFILNTG